VSLSDGFVLFNTAVGHCGIAWSVNGIAAVQLPEIQGIQHTRARLVKMFPKLCERPPTPEVQDAIFRIVDLLGGGADDLKSIRLDMSGIPAFSQKVYEVARNIAPGQTLTYGQVATKMSDLVLPVPWVKPWAGTLLRQSFRVTAYLRPERV
jgi:methylated-DNA-[protein]-cysteine S-methyltransferase